MSLEITEWLECMDGPGDAEVLELYRARCFRMPGNRIAVVADLPENPDEVHPKSWGSVDRGGASSRPFW